MVVIPMGGGLTVKTFDVPGGIGGPRWSPDGRALQYLLTRDGATNLWEQPLTGGERQGSLLALPAVKFLTSAGRSITRGYC